MPNEDLVFSIYKEFIQLKRKTKVTQAKMDQKNGQKPRIGISFKDIHTNGQQVLEKVST